MKIPIPDISKQIYKEDTLNVLVNNYAIIGPQWTAHQMEWANSIYASFKDPNKFLIIIYLIKKTLDFYSRNFTKLSYQDFYSRNTVEIEKFNVIEISKNIDLPKESTRRKIIELEKSGIIKRNNKKILIDRSIYPFVKPDDSIKRISRFLSAFSKILNNKKILPTELSSEHLEKVIKANFTHVWKIYYEFQIPMLLNYKKIFGDIETFHVFGTCIVNQHSHAQKLYKNKMTKAEFIKSTYSDKQVRGVSAMSISDITGIPRATVVRKLKKLLKQNFLTIDNKKHYKLTGNFIKKLIPLQSVVLGQLANFSTKIYNLTIL